MIYSDWNMIVLQLVMERITGKQLDVLATEKIFRPLGMTDTQFQPSIALRSRIAPTQVDDGRGGLLWGSVHDENAWAIGGVAGHAGLFSTARDLAFFSMMILNGGEGANGIRIAKPATIARWTSRQGKIDTHAGMGFARRRLERWTVLLSLELGHTASRARRSGSIRKRISSWSSSRTA